MKNIDDVEPVIIECKIIFLRMGTINTINENFGCQAYVESSWEDYDIFNRLLRTSENELNFVEDDDIFIKLCDEVKKLKYDPTVDWSPMLYIENAIGDLKEEKTYKLDVVRKLHINENDVDSSIGFYTYTIKVMEMRYIEGVFYERLELYDFPMDLQELTLKVTSKLPYTEVKIIENSKEPSSISTEVFLNQQEWDLFDYVTCSERIIFDTFSHFNRSSFCATSFIVRKPGYYINNAYMLIFLITVLGFVPFSVDVTLPNARMTVAGVLILTQVNFRWIITQRIPSVPYLTSVDKYAIGNLFFLVLFAIWHSIIGSSLFNDYSSEHRNTIDTIILGFFTVSFIIYNFAFIISLVRIKLKTERRRKKN